MLFVVFVCRSMGKKSGSIDSFICQSSDYYFISKSFNNQIMMYGKAGERGDVCVCLIN